LHAHARWRGADVADVEANEPGVRLQDPGDDDLIALQAELELVALPGILAQPMDHGVCVAFATRRLGDPDTRRLKT
jgi:hypothetical protein